ncbi:MAG: hypothetical protein A2583_15660 [Bdellovibrionales bacterium RIFOXYD1_FULL_53_11]|nr:MAG: hypothetical protein A2583_15660 [Bdellovibrionales bacterium RIFOXYD1_FULL_53_11]
MLGIHEGSVDEGEAGAAEWTLDSAQAPPARDWVGDSAAGAGASVYFSNVDAARDALEFLSSVDGVELLSEVEEKLPGDWMAAWREGFKGLRVEPCWAVLPPWLDAPADGARPGDVRIKINPGAGFGTGTHETTQLCLGAIGDRRSSIAGKRVLDFGSGSGILAIASALLGARADAVEVDPLARDNALANSALNGVALEFTEHLGPACDYDIVIANILRPVLVEHARELCGRLRRGGAMILSGLLEKDVREVSDLYSALLGAGFAVREKGDWRALEFFQYFKSTDF